MKIPYFGPLHTYLISWDSWWKKRTCVHAWASMSKHEQTWASMLNPLILTGLTSRSPILALHMLIPNHETIYGDKKEQVNAYEQAWVSMSKNAKSADFNRFDIKIPYFGPPHIFLKSWDPQWWREKANGTPFLSKYAFFLSFKASFVICKKSSQSMISNFCQYAIFNLSGVHVVLVQSLLLLFSILFKWHET